MESVSHKPYYSYYGSVLFAAHSNSASPKEDSGIFRQQTLDIYNLRPRDTPVMSKQEASGNIVTTISGAKRERQKPTQRSRTSYNKRLLVNARERERMKTLNKGFENLRNALPCYIADGHISKITTLRLAINYIKTLTEVLTDTKNQDHFEEEHPTDEMALVENLKAEGVIYENARPITPHFSSSDSERSTTTTNIDRAFNSIFEKNTFLKPSKTEH